MDKLLYIILDGVADRPNKILDGKTPLEAASTPHLDYFAREGKLGYVYTVKEGIAPESDIAVYALLGNKPEKHTGRGPIEALGSGMTLPRNYLAMRTNFATLKGDEIVDRRAGRIITKKEGKVLEDAINSINLSVPFKFKHTISHRGVVVFEGVFSPNISNTDPAYTRVGTFGVVNSKFKNKVQECKPLENSLEANNAALVVNEFVSKVRDVLSRLELNEERIQRGLNPVNGILLRDAGVSLPKMVDLNKLTGRKWASIVGMPLENGLSILAHIKPIHFSYPDVEDLHSFLITEIKEALKNISKSYDAFYIHIKQTDIPGHDGNPMLKKELIEILDQEFFSRLVDQDFDICVTADHATPCELKAHSSDPVPLLFFSRRMEGDSAKRFTEKEAMKGSLGKLYGYQVPLLF